MPSVNDWIKKLWCICVIEYYTAGKKKLLPFTVARMDLESIMLSEMIQVVKDNYHMISLINGS